METDPIPAIFCQILNILKTSDVIKNFDCIYIVKTASALCFQTDQINFSNFGRRSLKDHLYQIIFKLTQ